MQNPRSFRRAFLLAAAGIVVVGAVNAPRAQAPAIDTKLPAFEVASVKRSESGDSRVIGGRTQPGGRFTMANVQLREIIRVAYRLESFQVSGGPDWINADRFDIVAKAESDAAPEQLLLMLRTLLAERFKLAVHRETRELPVFALVVARSDGKLGPQLRYSDANCVAAATGPPSGRTPGRPDPSQPPQCGSGRLGLGRFTARAQKIEALSLILSTRVSRSVLDRTGLTGYFDFDLEWTPAAGEPGLPPPNGPANDRPDDSGPSIFTALQEQLGLKLDPQRGPVGVLIIDHAEQPTPD
jgi:uncharacterized protein (TIGR03435 family)